MNRHKVKVGAIVFTVLLPLVYLVFLVLIHMFFPSVSFCFRFFAPFLLTASIAVAGRGSFDDKRSQRPGVFVGSRKPHFC